jgi:hypothetical protein
MFDGALSAKKLVPRRSFAAQNMYEDNTLSIAELTGTKLALACVKQVLVLGMYGYM